MFVYGVQIRIQFLSYRMMIYVLRVVFVYVLNVYCVHIWIENTCFVATEVISSKMIFIYGGNLGTVLCDNLCVESGVNILYVWMQRILIK